MGVLWPSSWGQNQQPVQGGSPPAQKQGGSKCASRALFFPEDGI